MMKKGFAVLVCAVMCMALLPSAAFAGEQARMNIELGSITIYSTYANMLLNNGTTVTYSDPDGYIIWGTSDKNTITVAEDTTVNITLHDARVELSDGNKHAFTIKEGATVNLTLQGNNFLESHADYQEHMHGIALNNNATLHIYGQEDGSGSLEVVGGSIEGTDTGSGISGSGIGFNLYIHSGTVKAKGGSGDIGGAGIGHYYYNANTMINISGGVVEAKGTGQCAGICASLDCEILISDGNVTATGGVNGGAGINDGGIEANHDREVRISGGTVIAIGNGGGAGIGGKGSGSTNGGNVIITGGTVTATGNGGGAGIGGGQRGDGGLVTISGGTVTATGIGGGAGIGGGRAGTGGGVTIIGGSVCAKGNDGGEDIGHGVNGNGSGTLVNDSDDDVYRISLELADAAAATPVASLDADNISYDYNMKDVKLLDGNLLYLYLPEGTQVNGVTTGDTPPREYVNRRASNPEFLIIVQNNHGGSSILQERSGATISNVTVSGTKGTPITQALATIELTGETFRALSEGLDVSGWFMNIPSGIAANINADVNQKDNTVTVAFTGTPTVTSSAAMMVTIPKDALARTSGESFAANPNANAKWAIAAPLPPAVTSPTADKAVSVMVGDGTTLRVTATNANRYQWQVDAGSGFANLPGATSASCALPPVTLASNGYRYRCLVSGNGGSATSPVFTLSVSAPVPAAVTSPTANRLVLATVGGRATLAVTATGATGYQWQIDRGSGFENLPGATGASHTTTPLTLVNSGYRYRCIVTGNGGNATSPVFTLNVTAPVPVPPTGDSSAPALWLCIALMACTGLACFILRRRRQNG